MNLTGVGSPFSKAPIFLEDALLPQAADYQDITIDGVVVDDEQMLYFEQLSKLYQFDFVDIDSTIHAAHFFAVREQVAKIETIILERVLFDADVIRERVAKQLSLDSHERKMAELGLALFYLDRDGDLPRADSLLEHRAQEIVTQLEECLTRRAAITDDPAIPSGKTDTLLRELTKMVFCEPQLYNLGALLAIRTLLKDPKLLISKYLDSEHRIRILNVIEKIASNTSFDLLFKKKVEVYPRLQDAIRICLKLTPHAEIKAHFVFQACLMAFFADIRQNGAPNCYAIAALIFTSENYTYKLFKMMLKWLEEGYFDLDRTTTIPLRELLEERLFYPKDLLAELPCNRVTSLVIFQQIAEALSLSTPALPNKVQPLSTTLSAWLEANGASAHAAYANALYSSYKFNPLNQMTLAILEFANMNGENATPPASGQLKSFVVDSTMSSLMKALNVPVNCLSVPFIDLLTTRIRERLRLHAENHDTVFREQDNLVVGNQTISVSNKDAEHLSSLLKYSIRVYGFDKFKYLLIPTFSDLQQLIIRLIQEVDNLLTREGEGHEPTARHLTFAAGSHTFRLQMATCFLENIQETHLSAQELAQSDLLFMSQSGGFAEEALRVVFGQKFKVERLSHCQTPYRLLEKLLSTIKTLDPSSLKMAKKILLKTYAHVWTLNPHCWDMMLDYQRDFYRFVQSNVFLPAKNKLASLVEPELIKRVIRKYSSNKKERQSLRAYLSQYPFLSHASLKEKLLTFAPPEKLKKMKRVIEKEFGKILLSKKDLSTLLGSLNIRLSAQQFKNLFDRVKGKRELSSQLALQLREGLIEEKAAILEIDNLEVALCRLKQLPIPIFLGDLNWMDTYREDPSHIYLMIVFRWTDQTPCYTIRTNGNDAVENKSKYTEFRIIYPD